VCVVTAEGLVGGTPERPLEKSVGGKGVDQSLKPLDFEKLEKGTGLIHTGKPQPKEGGNGRG